MPTLKKGLDGRYYTRTNINGDMVTLHFHPDVESYIERYSINIDSNLPDTWICDTKNGFIQIMKIYSIMVKRVFAGSLLVLFVVKMYFITKISMEVKCTLIA